MSQHPFESLLPDFIINAVESCGYLSDGRILALNSYENRVYQVGIEEEAPLIAKFYRPGRWRSEQILEEHQFCSELVEQGLPVLAPLSSDEGQTLFEYQAMRFALYKRQGGHAPELDDLESLKRLGRMVGRIHAVGAQAPFHERPTLDIASYGEESVEFILERFIPMELKTAYESLVRDILKCVKEQFAAVSSVRYLRTHTDCHIGNMLCRGDDIHFVDFDDSRMAPAIQDLWMLLSGDRLQQTVQMEKVLEGYEQFYDFDIRELRLIEPLRALRVLHYSAWLARRWDDPAFPHNFPWFNTMRYWSDHILQLREQFADLMEPTMQLI